MNELRLASVASVLVVVGCGGSVSPAETEPSGQGGGRGATSCVLSAPSTATPPAPARDRADDGRGPFSTSWAASWGVSGVFDLAADVHGDLLVLAAVSGAVDLGGGVVVDGGERGRTIVAKLDPTGHGIWAAAVVDSALEVVSDGGGGAWVTNGEESVTGLTHFDGRGDAVFHAALDLSSPRMVSASDGGVLLAGDYGSGLVLDDGEKLPQPGPWDGGTAIAVVRVAADGRLAGATPLEPLVWSAPGSERISHFMTFLDVAATPDGGAVVLYRANEQAEDASCASNGTYLTRLDAKGGLAFTTELPAALSAGTVTVDAAGRIVTSGDDAIGVSLASFDATGNIGWSNTFPYDFGIVRPIVRRDGEIFLAGAFSRELYLGGGETFDAGGAIKIAVAEIASDGAFVSARTFDGAPASEAGTPADYAGDVFAAMLDTGGALVLAGDYFGALDLGAGPLPIVPEPENGAVLYHGYLARMAR